MGSENSTSVLSRCINLIFLVIVVLLWFLPFYFVSQWPFLCAREIVFCFFVCILNEVRELFFISQMSKKTLIRGFAMKLQIVWNERSKELIEIDLTDTDKKIKCSDKKIRDERRKRKYFSNLKVSFHLMWDEIQKRQTGADVFKKMAEVVRLLLIDRLPWFFYCPKFEFVFF